MPSTPLRNPLAGFVVAILTSALLSGVAGFASTFIPYMEFRLFFLGFALFGVGVFAGRRTFLGSLGFVGAFLGAFVGLYVAEQLFWTNGYMEILALAFAAAAGLGGLVTGKLGLVRLDRLRNITPGPRRCQACGARVGVSARKCWSCKATLST